jgi:hypothetical protein
MIGDMIHAAKCGAPLPDTETVRNRLALNRDPGDTGITVAAWLGTWLAGKRRASTVRSYESHSRLYILPVIGSVDVLPRTRQASLAYWRAMCMRSSASVSSISSPLMSTVTLWMVPVNLKGLA